MPDHKTIAELRKDNSQAVRGVCREFIVLCRRLNLFTQALVVIDGSKFKAANHRDNNFTRAKMKRRLAQIEASLDRYLEQLERADREEACLAETKTGRLEDKIATLKQEMRRLKKLESQLQKVPDKPLSLTDPDARSMKSRGATHFLTKPLTHVSTEMSLHVLAYNLKRAMNIIGVKPLIHTIQP